MDGQPLAIVTGAAQRLGRAFTLALARNGYAVLIHHHNSEARAQQVAAEVRAVGGEAFLARANLRRPDEIATLFEAVDRIPHPLKLLVNSAATIAAADVRTLSAADWDSVLDLNLRAPFLCAQQAARRMTDGGLIVNISDVGARKTWSRFPSYSVSKAGLEALTRILARALAPSIRVNSIAPGLVLPSDETPQEEWDRLVERLPLKRPAAAEEIASALEFLIKNQYVTGQTLAIDGGYSLLG